MDPKQIVERGYDQVFDRYEAWNADAGDNPRLTALERALPLLPSRESALDLGCGTGWHATRHLAAEFGRVIAVDLSPKSIAAARARLPGVEFLVGDMTQLDLASASFDLVTAFFSIIHVPAAEQPDLLRRIAEWLTPGGVLVCTLGVYAGDAFEEFLGAPMFWSGRDTPDSVAMVEEAGLRVLWAELDTQVEHGATVSFLWLTARRS